jgi:hypothetical protein
MLKKVISGGQTGADRGGLDAALKLGIPIGGWCPKGRRAEDGVIPVKYAKLQEAPVANYLQRTEWNVRDADATLIITYDLKASSGTKRTVDICKKLEKPWFNVLDEISMFNNDSDGYDHMAGLLTDFEILNVAGPRESIFPGIKDTTRDRLIEIFSRLV